MTMQVVKRLNRNSTEIDTKNDERYDEHGCKSICRACIPFVVCDVSNFHKSFHAAHQPSKVGFWRPSMKIERNSTILVASQFQRKVEKEETVLESRGNRRGFKYKVMEVFKRKWLSCLCPFVIPCLIIFRLSTFLQTLDVIWVQVVLQTLGHH